MTNPDTLLDALNASTRQSVPRGTSKIDVMFADRPEYLQAIRDARQIRRLSLTQIADLINAHEPDNYVSASTLGLWFRKQGISCT